MSDKWAGYSCYRLARDGKGKFFPDGARYVVFRYNQLVAEASSVTEADKAFLAGEYMSLTKSEYVGIDERLRGV